MQIKQLHNIALHEQLSLKRSCRGGLALRDRKRSQDLPLPSQVAALALLHMALHKCHLLSPPVPDCIDVGRPSLFQWRSEPGLIGVLASSLTKLANGHLAIELSTASALFQT